MMQQRANEMEKYLNTLDKDKRHYLFGEEIYFDNYFNRWMLCDYSKGIEGSVIDVLSGKMYDVKLENMRRKEDLKELNGKFSKESQYKENKIKKASIVLMRDYGIPRQMVVFAFKVFSVIVVMAGTACLLLGVYLGALIARAALSNPRVGAFCFIAAILSIVSVLIAAVASDLYERSIGLHIPDRKNKNDENHI